MASGSAIVSIGVVVHFLLYGLLSRAFGPSAGGTLWASAIAGFSGVILGVFGIVRLGCGKGTAVWLAMAYIVRVGLGVLNYHSTDPSYFRQGGYENGNWEFYWTYDQAARIADNLQDHGAFELEAATGGYDNKNKYIHAWMGMYFAVGGSRNGLDLAALNAFHHVVAALILYLLCMEVGLGNDVARRCALVVAWIPWAFAADIMWRDSVGFSWMIAGVYLLTVAARYRVIDLRKHLCFGAALFLMYSNRKAYILVPAILALPVYLRWDFGRYRRGSVVAGAVVGGVVVLALPYIERFVQLSSAEGSVSGFVWRRLLYFPLLAVRALAGPFPWVDFSDLSRIGDYGFHVLQLSVLLRVILCWRIIDRSLSVMYVSGILLYCIAVVAGGVHTAYLVVGFPFLLPLAFADRRRHIWFLGVAMAMFILANIVYLALGFHGQFLMMKTTGY